MTNQLTEVEDLQSSPEDDFDLDDCDIADLINSVEPCRYDGDAESGPCEPTFWIEPVTRYDCDRCGRKDQRVIRTTTEFASFDPTQAYHLACGHVVI